MSHQPDLTHIKNTWAVPPQIVADIVQAPNQPSVMLSPDARHMLLIETDTLSELADLARPMLRLAGMRIDPQTQSRFQTRYRKAILYRAVDDDQAEAKRIVIDHPDLTFDDSQAENPSDARKIGAIRWSHDNRHFAFSVVHQEGSAIFVASIDHPTAVLVHRNVSQVMIDFEWLPDGKHLLFAIVPEDRVEVPPRYIPTGPRIEESDGETSPTRTFQDLLKNPHDEKTFANIVRTEIVIAALDGQIIHRLAPALYANASVSPDGQHLLVTTLQQPFSYLLTWYSFAMTIHVTDLDGNQQYTVAEIPLAENIPVEGVRIQPRQIHWMSGRTATICFATALDGGDPNVPADYRDRVFEIAAPFTEAPAPMMDVQHRFYGMGYFADGRRLITTEYDRDRRWLTTRLYDTTASLVENQILVDRSVRDRYGDPGSLIQSADSTGHHVVTHWTSPEGADCIFRAGQGATERGNRPFLDMQNLNDLSVARLWQCSDDSLESVIRLRWDEIDDADADASTGKLLALTMHQSPLQPPNLRLRAMPKEVPSKEESTENFTAVTHFKDPTPQIRGIKRELVTYERSDGVQLSATLYLPEDHQPGQRLPLLLWAYPQEFNDPATAGQVVGNPNQFTRMSGISHLTLAMLGYAVMDNATMPVVGEPETMNDTFLEQIVDAAKSAIDFAVAKGVADADRVAVGGHSYGAFMTANLLAHCDLFKAGIARSGAYNRTLTPFGFQAERRPLWEAADVYLRVSPFMHADKISDPLLIMHGEKDNNPGTFPLQSERLYQAIKGTGGTARLVMLPYESHGYVARHSVLHCQAETIAWLDKYLK